MKDIDKDITEYFKKYSIDQIAKNRYYYKKLIEIFGNENDIPEKYIKLYENCSLIYDDIILVLEAIDKYII